MTRKNDEAFFREIYNNRQNCENREHDYKLQYHFKEQKDKLNLVKDIVSFANTLGGYLVFGVTDKDYEWVGLDGSSDKLDEEQIRGFMKNYVTKMPEFSCGLYVVEDKPFILITIDKDEFGDIFMKKDGEYAAKKYGSDKESNHFIFRKNDLYGRIGSSSKPVNDDPTFRKMRSSKTGKVSNLNDVPKPFNTTFIERPKESNELLQGLNSPNIRNMQINGLGGVGKTSFVRDFCDKVISGENQLVPSVEYLVWITGKLDYFSPSGEIQTIRSTKLTYKEMLETLTGVFGIYASGKGMKEQEEEVFNILKNYPSLLIFDNMETIDDPLILDFCQKVPPQTRLIFTTRSNLQNIQYSTIYMSGFNEKQFEDYIFEKIRTQERTNWENHLGVIKPHINKLHQLTKGSPALIDFVLGKLCGGCAIDALIHHLDKLQNGDDYYDKIMQFCFDSSFESLNKKAIDALWVMSISDEETEAFSVHDLAAILDRSVDNISDVLEKLYGISFVSRIQEKYQCPILVRAFANKRISQKYNDEVINKLASKYYKWKDDQNTLTAAEELRYNRVKAYDYSRKRAVAEVRDIKNRYDAKEDFAAAMQDFEKVLKDCPDYAFIYFERAKFAEEGENYDLARADYEKAIKCDPRNDYYLSQFGYSLLRQAKIDFAKSRPSSKGKLAINCFEKALTIADHPNIHQGLALAMSKTCEKQDAPGRRDEIEHHFEKGFYNDEVEGSGWRNARNAHAYASFLYHKCGDSKKALDICLRGLRYEPDDRKLLDLESQIKKPSGVGASKRFKTSEPSTLRSGIFASASDEDLEKLQSLYQD